MFCRRRGISAIAFILLIMIGMLIMRTGDVTWLILLVVYGVDGCCTIIHRIMLHENLGEAHRKHLYQLMANELKIGHMKVTFFYIILQLVISLGFVSVVPYSVWGHLIYMGVFWFCWLWGMFGLWGGTIICMRSIWSR